MIDQVAPDGSPVAVFASFPAGPAPERIGSRLREGASVLDLGCGAGRLGAALAAKGHRVTGVDISPEMVAAAPDVGGLEVLVADIDGLELGRRFDGVVLASYLVNDPDRQRASRFLETCRRHVSDGGRVFVQRHHPGFLAETDVLDSEEDGFGFRFERLSLGDDGRVRARMTYGHDGRAWTQEFETVILDDDALRAALEGASLVFSRWLDDFETWAEAVPA